MDLSVARDFYDDNICHATILAKSCGFRSCDGLYSKEIETSLDYADLGILQGHFHGHDRVV